MTHAVQCDEQIATQTQHAISVDLSLKQGQLYEENVLWHFLDKFSLCGPTKTVLFDAYLSCLQ